MGRGRDEPAPEGDDAELRQIDSLNRMKAGPQADGGRDRAGRGPAKEAGPGRARPDQADQADVPGRADSDQAQDRDRDRDPRQDGGRDRSRDQDPSGGPSPVADRSSGGAARRRDALLLGTGHTVADAESLDDVLKALSGLSAPGFEVDGQTVFGITGMFLNKLGQYGFRPGGADRNFRMPLATGYPAAEVMRTGRAVYLASADEYRSRFPATYPLTAPKGRRSWAFLPLVTSGRISGVWLVAFRSPVAFTADERALLTVTARLVARALERTRTGEAELALSRGLRSSMGRAGPSFAGMSVAARYVPTGGGLVVGGDWFDSIELPSGRLALVIGDVQGHDVHAASLMTQLRTAVHAYAAEGHGPDAVLARASRFLATLDEDRFATCIYMEADPATGVLQMARAGHPHPVLRMPDGTCMLKHIRGGLPLGLMPGEDDYPVTAMELRDEEILLLCTDGLIETGGFDMYTGWVRVRDALSPGPTTDLEGMADRLIRTVSGGTQAPDAGGDAGRGSPRNEDDIALLLLRRDAGLPKPALPERRLVLTIEQDRAESLSQARAELEAVLHDWARADQVEAAVLLASELLGNVLVHTDQAAAMTATLTGRPGRRTLRVEVTDRGDELPHQRAPGELASSGRGLVLLDLLSDECGVRPEPEGKTVWFSLTESPQTPEPSEDPPEPAGPPEPAEPAEAAGGL
jgi:anti-sigma regulatory factor (Ser/Thr protein kinase)